MGPYSQSIRKLAEPVTLTEKLRRMFAKF